MFFVNLNSFIRKNWKYILFVSIIFIIILISFLYYIFKNEKSEPKPISDSLEILKNDIGLSEEKKEDEKIYYIVDIKGEVINPGVYTLESGSRVIDVINASGGLTEYANTRYINLSKKISDEMTIIIYSNYEIESYNKKDVIIEECKCEEVTNDSCLDNNLKEEIEDINKDNNLININTASKEELMTLNGIGEAKAELIIEYRENKKFESIEEIKEVSGISESIYEKIKDFIKI